MAVKYIVLILSEVIIKASFNILVSFSKQPIFVLKNQFLHLKYYNVQYLFNNRQDHMADDNKLKY